jgi:hypothetical protein
MFLLGKYDTFLELDARYGCKAKDSVHSKSICQSVLFLFNFSRNHKNLQFLVFGMWNFSVHWQLCRALLE